MARLIEAKAIAAVRLTPWRSVLLENADMPEGTDFVTDPADPVLHVNACVGAPYCASATVSTRDIARRLAPHIDGTLHVSGCAKGCARRTPANVTLVGRDGAFDIVRDGTAADDPNQRGLDPHDLITGAPFFQ